MKRGRSTASTSVIAFRSLRPTGIFSGKFASAPHIGYRLLCHLAEADLIRSVWSTNFDGLSARSAGDFKLSPIEVGIDSQGRAARQAGKGELLCVSLHGDYRYDDLKNTPEELQRQEESLRAALIEELRQRPLIVCGYSGRDQSIMEALRAACAADGNGTLYWCGYGDGDAPEEVASLIEHARTHGRQAFYIPSLGFDDLMTRISLYCLDGEHRDAARRDIAARAPVDRLECRPFEVPDYQAKTVIKSNAFEVDCPAEVLAFDLKAWPTEKVWSWLRDRIGDRAVVAVPFKRKIYALGTVDDIKDIFGDNLKGPVQRTPVSPDDLRFEDGAIVSLMREGLVRAMAERAGCATNGRSELWLKQPLKKVREGGQACVAHEAVVVFLRRVGGAQYIVLKPSIKVLDEHGEPVAHEIAGPVKLRILGYQHNKPFNTAMNKWRELLSEGGSACIRIPGRGWFRLQIPDQTLARICQDRRFEGRIDCCSSEATPTSAQASRPGAYRTGACILQQEWARTIRYSPCAGHRRQSPLRLSTDRSGRSLASVGCRLSPERDILAAVLPAEGRSRAPAGRFRARLSGGLSGVSSGLYGLPLEIPEPGAPGWVECAEPSGADQRSSSVSVAQQITAAVETLRSSYAPHVILIFFSKRVGKSRGYRDDNERFDVHDFVKAYAVQRGSATQFLTEDTLSNSQQCRVWWWLSLAFYVKGMRTPWVLDGLDRDTAYVGLGFSLDRNAARGSYVVWAEPYLQFARRRLLIRLTRSRPLIGAAIPSCRRTMPAYRRDYPPALLRCAYDAAAAGCPS